MVLYGLKQCDTCRKALKMFPDVTFVDVRKDGVPDEIMAQALAQFGDALVNRRSKTWREMDAQARSEPVLTMLAAHPTLMKRPLIATNTGLFLGWDKDVQAALLS